MIRKLLTTVLALLLLSGCTPAKETTNTTYDPQPGMPGAITAAESEEPDGQTAVTDAVDTAQDNDDLCTSAAIGMAFHCPPANWEVEETELAGGSITMSFTDDNGSSSLVLSRDSDWSLEDWERYLVEDEPIGGLKTLFLKLDQRWLGFIVLDPGMAIHIEANWQHDQYAPIIKSMIRSLRVWE